MCVSKLQMQEMLGYQIRLGSPTTCKGIGAFADGGSWVSPIASEPICRHLTGWLCELILQYIVHTCLRVGHIVLYKPDILNRVGGGLCLVYRILFVLFLFVSLTIILHSNILRSDHSNKEACLSKLNRVFKFRQKHYIVTFSFHTGQELPPPNPNIHLSWDFLALWTASCFAVTPIASHWCYSASHPDAEGTF